MNPLRGNPIINSACQVDVVNYEGWSALRLSNGILELFIVPEIGGRIIQLRLGKVDYFYVNHRHFGRIYPTEENTFDRGWKNYGGSKVWPAPQGWSDDCQWPGPPDPVLDGGPYRSIIDQEDSKSIAIKLESPEDEYTGLKFFREIRLFRDSAKVEITHRIRNTSLRPVRWSIWQVTQQAARQGLSITVPSKGHRQIYGDELYRNCEVLPDRDLWRLSYINQVAKFVINPESGWLATLHGGLHAALVEIFPVFHDVTYPDGGPVEIWVNGKGTFTAHEDKVNMEDDPNGCDPYIETEILSPLVLLEPGQQYTFRVGWQCCITAGTSIFGINPCGVIETPLLAKIEGGRVLVKGSFGIFQSGTLEIALVHRSGKNGPVHAVGPVKPSVACLIDESIPFEDELFRVALRLRNTEGKLLGTIDGAEIR